MDEDQASLVLSVQDHELKEHNIKDAYRIDLHHHTFYSGYDPARGPKHMYVDTPPTRLLRVHECHSEPLDVLVALEKAGMKGFTFLDHDSVSAMTGLVDRYKAVNGKRGIFGRKRSRQALLEKAEHYCQRSFVSCEYSVNVLPDREQRIHVGVYGLDYAEGSRGRLPNSSVHALHRDLLCMSKKGYDNFGDFCRRMGLPFAFMHPLWQSNADDPLSARQLDELTDYFPMIEINADHQYENLAALLIALEKDKPIVAGTDDHALRRSGRVWTSPLKPVSTPREFLDELAAGRVGIGSRYSVPEGVKAKERDCMDRYRNIIRHMFYGPLCEFQRDAYKITWDHLAGRGNWRNPARYLTLGLALGIPAVFAALGVPEVAIPLFSAEMLPVATMPFLMTGIEKMDVNLGARRLHGMYNRLVKSRHQKRLAAERRELESERADLERRFDDLCRRQRELDRRYPERIPMVRAKQGRVSRFLYGTSRRLPFMRRSKKMLEPDDI